MQEQAKSLHITFLSCFTKTDPIKQNIFLRVSYSTIEIPQKLQKRQWPKKWERCSRLVNPVSLKKKFRVITDNTWISLMALTTRESRGHVQFSFRALLYQYIMLKRWPVVAYINVCIPFIHHILTTTSKCCYVIF